MNLLLIESRIFRATDFWHGRGAFGPMIVIGIVIFAVALIGLPIVYLTGGFKKSTPDESQMVGAVCPGCGLPLAVGVTTCPECGRIVTGTSATAQPAAGAGTGVIQRNVVVGGAVAFQKGEIVQVEGVQPDAANPANRYIVQSAALGKKFLLSDQDLMR